jgi:CspA family cold shock protein
MLKGKVKWFDDARGFGFVLSESGEELFFHKTGISPEFVPFEGCPVTFDRGEGRKGPKAVNVRAA